MALKDTIWLDTKTPPPRSPQSEKVGSECLYKGQKCTIITVEDSGPNPITIQLPDESTVQIARTGQYFDDSDETLKNIGDE